MAHNVCDGSVENDRSSITEQWKGLLRREECSSGIYVECVVKVFFGRGREGHVHIANARAREQNVEMTFLLLDCVKQAVEISQISGITLDARYVLAYFLDRLIELFLAASCNEYISPLFHEQLGSRQRHA